MAQRQPGGCREWRSWGGKVPGAVLTAVAANSVCACGQTCLRVQAMEPVVSHCTWPPWKARVVIGPWERATSLHMSDALSQVWLTVHVLLPSCRVVTPWAPTGASRRG